MLDSDIEIRFNFRQLKFKWKTVFHLKNETQALVVKQIFIKLKWGESKGAGFERDGFRLTVTAAFGVQKPCRWKAYLPRHQLNSVLTTSNCFSAYAAPCLLINVSTGYQHSILLAVYERLCKQIKVISTQTSYMIDLVMAVSLESTPILNHEEMN